jgi:hypothetical protein
LTRDREWRKSAYFEQASLREKFEENRYETKFQTYPDTSEMPVGCMLHSSQNVRYHQ